MDDLPGLKTIWPTEPNGLEKHEHDVVLVHGLYSGSVSDWTAENGACWPRDFLPQDLENTRILSFGYHRKESTRTDNGGERVFILGETLCSDLQDQRKANTTITFIGHGTGGIVIKSALCYSHACETHYGSILQNTRLVVFLDTPHLGLSSDEWKSISGRTTSGTNADQWRLWSRVLSELRQRFSGIANGFDITSSYASVRKPSDPEDQDIPGASGLTGLPNERVLHFENADHHTISKFMDRTSINYERLLNRLQSGRKLRTHDVQDFANLRQWLREGDEDEINLNIHNNNLDIQRRYSSTCQWLFADPIFKEWIGPNPSSQCLWVTGPSGAGKSTLCSVALNHLAAQRIKPATPFMFVTLSKERSRCHMYKILASQLLEHLIEEQDGIDKEVLRLLRFSSGDATHVQTLISSLVSQCSQVYFFVDGLDEICPVHGVYDKVKCPKRDLSSVLKFLYDLSGNGKSPQIRLWCSSQNVSHVHECMGDVRNVLRLNLSGSDSVREDVQTYLSAVIHEVSKKLSHPLDQEIAPLLMRRRAGGSFRWAAMMEQSLQKSSRDTDVINKIVQGLPTDLRTIYTKAFEDMREQDQVDVKEGGSPMSMTILAIVACARRPLRVKEVQEAASIALDSLHMRDCRNLDVGRTISPDDAIHRCSPLLDHIATKSTSPGQGYIVVSHASVYEFLFHNWHQDDKANTEPTGRPVVDNEVIANVCLKYLSQSRYRSLIARSEDVRDHHFLQYAAKYWYRHFGELGDSEERRVAIETFLESPQFLTTLQVQSLFVAGHFIQTLDVEMKYERRMKKNIPAWFRDSAGGKSMMDDYEKFLSEWGLFLQKGISTSKVAGDVRRCFWGALGSSNFLSKHRSIERNKSFLLDHDPTKGKNRHSCIYETVSDDGLRLSVWSVVSNSEDATFDPHLERYVWYLNGKRKPVYYGTDTISFDTSCLNWAQYDPCRLARFPLTPSLDSAERPPPIEVIHHGVSMRVGSGQFIRRQGGNWIRPDDDGSQSPLPYWEEIISRPPYVIKTRRRLVTTLPFNDCDEESVNHEDDDDSEAAYPVLDDISSAEEFCSESSLVSEPATDLSGSEEPSAPETEFSNSTRDEVETESDSASQETKDDGQFSHDEPDGMLHTKMDDSGSAKSNKGVASDACNDENSDADDENSIPDEDCKPPAHFQRLRIVRNGYLGRRNCDICGDIFLSPSSKRPECWFTCNLCTPQDTFDLCLPCFQKGNWCSNKSHNLQKMAFKGGYAVVKEMLTTSRSRPGVNIEVQRKHAGGLGTVFQYHTQEFQVLYDSPSVIHPHTDLLIYALDGRRLLFCSFSTNSFFIHKVPVDLALSGAQRHADIVCAKLRFSHCGQYLYVLRVAAVSCEDGTANQTWNTNKELLAHLVTVQLSQRRPASRRPRTLPRRHAISLGKWDEGVVPRLPFTVTWTDQHAYVSVSGERLLVLRMPLEGDSLSGEDACAQEVETLSGWIDLPRSARFRSVYFFPPKVPQTTAVVVLGARVSNCRDPPVVVYLERDSIGHWEKAANARTEEIFEIRKDPLIEEFDSDSDCDLFVPRYDFQT